MGCFSSSQHREAKVDSQYRINVANTTTIEASASASSVLNDPLILRFLAINDVYLLKNLPYYCTAKKVEAHGADLVVGTLAGDFLMPSELSSIDKGMSIVDCLGKAGVDYVCLGNHENDLPFDSFLKCVKQSKFEWINTNVANIPFPADMKPLPEYKVLTAQSKSGRHTRKVALLGLLTDDPTCMMKGCFGGCTIANANETAAVKYKEIMSIEAMDAIIPMTHQDIDVDRVLASMNIGFPLILGGHEHTIFDELVSGCRIFKAGLDCETIGVIDLIWDSPADGKPRVVVTQKAAASYKPDAELCQLVAKYSECLEILEKTELFPLPDRPLSSQNVRSQPSSFATYLFSVLRHIMHVDCVLISGGNIRGNVDYTGKTIFTYSDLKKEFPFEHSDVAVVYLPGWLIAKVIEYTRHFVFEKVTTPYPSGCYMQTDDGITWDSSKNKVLTIAGKPVDKDKIYKVTMAYLTVFKGMDDIQPLVEYVGERMAQKDPAFNIHPDRVIDLKHLIVGHFSMVIMLKMITALPLSEIQTEFDGKISREELISAATKLYGDHGTEILINNLMQVADVDNSGYVDKDELLQLYFSPDFVEIDNVVESLTMDDINKLDFDDHGVITADHLFEVIRSKCNSTAATDVLLKNIISLVDEHHDGHITKANLRHLIEMEERGRKQSILGNIAREANAVLI